MSEIYAMLLFTALIIFISSILVLLIHSNHLDNIKIKENQNFKMMIMKSNMEEKRRNGLRMVRQELELREKDRKIKQLKEEKEKELLAQEEQYFTVYDITTGIAHNYCEKKR